MNIFDAWLSGAWILIKYTGGTILGLICASILCYITGYLFQRPFVRTWKAKDSDDTILLGFLIWSALLAILMIPLCITGYK